jgi:hypothetical protein
MRRTCWRIHVAGSVPRRGGWAIRRRTAQAAATDQTPQQLPGTDACCQCSSARCTGSRRQPLVVCTSLMRLRMCK